jgi:hypothetical protein
MHRAWTGRYLADDSLWIAMATMMATLSFSKEIGEDGKEIKPERAFTFGMSW